MQDNPWLYNNEPVLTPPEDYAGFIYLITNPHTGKQYIGKKIFLSTTRVKQKGKTRRKVVKKESDWQKYYGSSDALKADLELYGYEGVKREIIRLCKTKSEMSYFESKEIFQRDALLREDFYNSWISCRIHGDNLKKLILED